MIYKFAICHSTLKFPWLSSDGSTFGKLLLKATRITRKMKVCQARVTGMWQHTGAVDRAGLMVLMGCNPFLFWVQDVQATPKVAYTCGIFNRHPEKISRYKVSNCIIEHN